MGIGRSMYMFRSHTTILLLLLLLLLTSYRVVVLVLAVVASSSSTTTIIYHSRESYDQVYVRLILDLIYHQYSYKNIDALYMMHICIYSCYIFYNLQ